MGQESCPNLIPGSGDCCTVVLPVNFIREAAKKAIDNSDEYSPLTVWEFSVERI